MNETDFFYQAAECAEDIRGSKCVINSNDYNLADVLRQKNYVFVDRTIKASIPLKESTDFSKLCRLKIEESAPDDRIKKLAAENFIEDVRFFASIPPKFDKELFADYFSQVKICYICQVKNDIAGFIEIVETADKSNGKVGMIRLAAVDSNYRLAGAALSLYAGAADLYRQKNFRRLEGRISCKNMPVLNLYASLGAVFSVPLDIYIRS